MESVYGLTSDMTAGELSVVVEEVAETLDQELGGTEDPEEVRNAAKAAVQYLLEARVIELDD